MPPSRKPFKSTVAAAWLFGALALGRLVHEYIPAGATPKKEATQLTKSSIHLASYVKDGRGVGEVAETVARENTLFTSDAVAGVLASAAGCGLAIALAGLVLSMAGFQVPSRVEPVQQISLQEQSRRWSIDLRESARNTLHSGHFLNLHQSKADVATVTQGVSSAATQLQSKADVATVMQGVSSAATQLGTNLAGAALVTAFIDSESRGVKKGDSKAARPRGNEQVDLAPPDARRYGISAAEEQTQPTVQTHLFEQNLERERVEDIEARLALVGNAPGPPDPPLNAGESSSATTEDAAAGAATTTAAGSAHATEETEDLRMQVQLFEQRLAQVEQHVSARLPPMDGTPGPQTLPLQEGESRSDGTGAATSTAAGSAACDAAAGAAGAVGAAAGGSADSAAACAAGTADGAAAISGAQATVPAQKPALGNPVTSGPLAENSASLVEFLMSGGRRSLPARLRNRPQHLNLYVDDNGRYREAAGAAITSATPLTTDNASVPGERNPGSAGTNETGGTPAAKDNASHHAHLSNSASTPVLARETAYSSSASESAGRTPEASTTKSIDSQLQKSARAPVPVARASRFIPSDPAAARLWAQLFPQENLISQEPSSSFKSKPENQPIRDGTVDDRAQAPGSETLRMGGSSGPFMAASPSADNQPIKGGAVDDRSEATQVPTSPSVDNYSKGPSSSDDSKPENHISKDGTVDVRAQVPGSEILRMGTDSGSFSSKGPASDNRLIKDGAVHGRAQVTQVLAVNTRSQVPRSKPVPVARSSLPVQPAADSRLMKDSTSDVRVQVMATKPHQNTGSFRATSPTANQRQVSAGVVQNPVQIPASPASDNRVMATKPRQNTGSFRATSPAANQRQVSVGVVQNPVQIPASPASDNRVMVTAPHQNTGSFRATSPAANQRPINAGVVQNRVQIPASPASDYRGSFRATSPAANHRLVNAGAIQNRVQMGDSPAPDNRVIKEGGSVRVRPVVSANESVQTITSSRSALVLPSSQVRKSMSMSQSKSTSSLLPANPAADSKQDTSVQVLSPVLSTRKSVPAAKASRPFMPSDPSAARLWVQLFPQENLQEQLRQQLQQV